MSLVGQMLGAVARKCPRIHVKLQIEHPWPSLLEELQRSPMPHVHELVAFLGPKMSPTCGAYFRTLFCGGEALPDLSVLNINTIPASPAQVANNPLDRMLKTNSLTSGSHFHKTRRTNPTSLRGLRKMESIRISNDVMLTKATLNDIFSSSEVFGHLTSLEIENCARIGQIPALRSLSTLLQRTLPTLKHLKIHLISKPEYLDGPKWQHDYTNMLAQDPTTHLCAIVRSLGQKIDSLDLALPFACNRMFLPYKRSNTDSTHTNESTQSPIAREPLATLPNRLLGRGIKYRRLICWQGVCMDQHGWEDMASYAVNQGSNMSWELVGDAANQGSWHVGESDMAVFTADSVLMWPD